jgi:hypothetical protein
MLMHNITAMVEAVVEVLGALTIIPLFPLAIEEVMAVV